MNSLLLIGCGGHANSLIDVVESSGDWKISGLVGTPEEVGKFVLGYKVIGCDNDLTKLREEFDFALLAVGQIGVPDLRIRLAQKLKRLDFTSPIVASNHAVVSSHSKIGNGTVIGHGAIVNAGASVGMHCIINSSCLIEHDTLVGDHSHVSTGALVNGGVTLGAGCFVGSGAILRENLKIPANTVISAGTRVMGWPLI